jgi:hypothetical protein
MQIHKNFVNLPGNVESMRDPRSTQMFSSSCAYGPPELADVADEIERSSESAPYGDVMVFKRRSAS